MTFDPDYICTVQVHAAIDEDILSKTLTKFYQKGGALDMNDTIYVNNNKWVVVRDPIYSISPDGDVQRIHIYLGLHR